MKKITSIQHVLLARPRQLPVAAHRLLNPPQNMFNPFQPHMKPVRLISVPYHHIWVRYFLLIHIYIRTPASCTTVEITAQCLQKLTLRCSWVCSNIKPKQQNSSIIIIIANVVSHKMTKGKLGPRLLRKLKFPTQTSSHILDLLRQTTYYTLQ